MSTPLANRRPFKSADIQLYCYTAPTSAGAYGRNEYGAVAEQITWTIAEPGGYTEASFKVYLPWSYGMPPELDFFSRVVIARGNDVRFIGEIDDSERWYQSGQSFIQIHALGLGNAIRDDPASFAYSGVTLQQIAKDQMNSRFNGTGSTFGVGFAGPPGNALIGVIDPDTSQLFPDNPAGTWAPAYDRKTMEEVFQDITTFGSTNGAIYVWGTEAHPVNKDPQGFPTLRMYIRKRDIRTTHYMASVADGEIDQYNFGRNAQYAYDVIDIDYNNASGGTTTAEGTGLVTVGGAVNAQRFNAFRYRKLSRDYTGITTVGGSQAGSIASTYVNEYAFPHNKGSVQLRSVRDANGNPIPLDVVTAGKNILIPDLVQPLDTPLLVDWATNTLLGTQLVTPIPGQNQFRIVSMQWQEDKQGPYVTLQLDTFIDRAANLVARLMLSADINSRSTKTGTFVFGPGIPDTVTGGGTTVATAGAQTVAWAFTWHAQMARVPTSATTSTISLVNGGGTFVNSLSVYGGNIGCVSTAAGAVTYEATITSHGNTLHRIGKATLHWHCRKCDTHHEKLSYKAVASRPGAPGRSALKVTCPACGMEEHFNTALESTHEVGQQHHAVQARLIRQLMKHPKIGLEVAA